MAITAASDTKLLPLFRPVVLADNLLQYEIKQETPIEIYFMGDGNIYKSDSIKNLLPFMFDKNSCKSQKITFIFQFLLEYLIFATDASGANLWEETILRYRYKLIIQ
jgi:hypothetical protein